jgi:hypothetical protein
MSQEVKERFVGRFKNGERPKMNEEVRELWAKALESNEFEQGRYALNKQDAKFCCLGVLTVLAERAGVHLAKREDERTGNFGMFRYGLAGQTGYLPGEVLAWAGLLTEDPYVTYKGTSEPLTALNDRGVQFKTIATIIREQL